MNSSPVVVLVHPQLALNIGMVARALANCGMRELRLVAPRDGWPQDAAQKTATVGKSILDAAQCFPDVASAVADRRRVVAATARTRDRNVDVMAYDALPSLGGEDALMFGPENCGLANEDLNYATDLLHLPVDPQHSSLSLPSAVLLAAHRCFVGRGESETAVPSQLQAAPLSEAKGFYKRLVTALDDNGYFRLPAMRRKTLLNLNALLLRTRPTTQELNSLHGMLSALTSNDSPDAKNKE